MPALLYGIEGWGKIGKDEMNDKKKDSRESIKNDFQLAKSNIIHWLNNGTWPTKKCGEHEQIQMEKAGGKKIEKPTE